MPVALPEPPPPDRKWAPSPLDPPRLWVLVKAVTLAVLAGVVAALLGTFVLVILWGVFFVGLRMGWITGETMATTLDQGRWVVAAVALALTVWAVGYGSSAKGSGPRIAAGLVLGLPIGLGLAAIGSDFWTLAGAGVGFAVAIPGRSIRVVAMRAAVPAILGLLALGFTVGTLRDELLFGLGGVLVAGLVVITWIGTVEPVLLRERVFGGIPTGDEDLPKDDHGTSEEEE